MLALKSILCFANERAKHIWGIFSKQSFFQNRFTSSLQTKTAVGPGAMPCASLKPFEMQFTFVEQTRTLRHRVKNCVLSLNIDSYLMCFLSMILQAG